MSGSGINALVPNGSCPEYIDTLQPAYRIVYLTAPVNWTAGVIVWSQRTQNWTNAFIASIALRVPFYLLIAGLSVFFLMKRGARFQAKHFPVIYTCMALLGISRVLFLLLDPYGVLGWIAHGWLPWVMLSRLLAAVGIPSLTASYTLVFLMLWKASDTDVSRQWHRKWKVILSIPLIYFFIALVAAIIANTSPYLAIIFPIGCKLFFSIWGMAMCVIYLIAGNRLIRKIKLQTMRSSRVSNTDMQQNQLEYRRRINQGIPARAIMKISCITYGTAVLGVIYSLVNLGALALVIYICATCFGRNGKGDSVMWLCLEICSKILEIMLAFILLYSVTDITRLRNALKRCFTLCCM